MFDSKSAHDYMTKSQMLQLRKTLDEKYTYNPRINKYPKRVLSPRRQIALGMPSISVDTDLERARIEADGILKVRTPKPIHRQIYYDLKEQEKRVMRVRAGQPISHVFHDENPRQWKLQEMPKNEILTEKQAITPTRKYLVPQMDPPIGYYIKHPRPDMPIGDLSINGLKGIMFEMNETERKKNNEILEEINRRNMRREKSMRIKYQTYLKKGMKAATREARRQEALSVLKTKRREEWWPEYIESFKQEEHDPLELKILNELLKTSFDEPGIMTFLNTCEVENWPPWLYKQMLRTANDYGKFMPPIKLGALLQPKNTKKLGASISTASVLSAINIDLKDLK